MGGQQAGSGITAAQQVQTAGAGGRVWEPVRRGARCCHHAIGACTTPQEFRQFTRAHT